MMIYGFLALGVMFSAASLLSAVASMFAFEDKKPFQGLGFASVAPLCIVVAAHAFASGV